MNEHVKRNKEKLNVNGHFSSSISLFCPLFSLLAHGGPIHYNSQSIAGMMRKRNRANFFASRFSFRSFRRYTCKIKWKSSLRAEWMHKKLLFVPECGRRLSHVCMYVLCIFMHLRAIHIHSLDLFPAICSRGKLRLPKKDGWFNASGWENGAKLG